MAEVVDESLRPRRLLLDFIAFFGGVALALSSLLTKMLYGVAATDPPTYVAVAVTLVAVAVVASWLPARRATSIDPMAALRA
jgi:ABC-type antimicrobial peptide transport system permease subunit